MVCPAVELSFQSCRVVRRTCAVVRPTRLSPRLSLRRACRRVKLLGVMRQVLRIFLRMDYRGDLQSVTTLGSKRHAKQHQTAVKRIHLTCSELPPRVRGRSYSPSLTVRLHLPQPQACRSFIAQQRERFRAPHLPSSPKSTITWFKPEFHNGVETAQGSFSPLVTCRNKQAESYAVASTPASRAAFRKTQSM